ncbi:MAG TPA: lamin tail domain-containing protein, partial [Phycisphaerae bacterium]|nr:lamin tail domain-containing protein [Phycisphaerae bacterium]
MVQRGSQSRGRGRRPSVPVLEPMEPRLLLDSTPIITEFMADTDVPWYPAAPDSDWDWIEIYNPTPSAINLSGWHLTDNPLNLSQWTFPACTLGVGEYRIVFASGRETGDPAHPADLHADFK